MSVMGPDLIGRLLDQHAAALMLYARQWCGAPEDIVQEAVLKLIAQKKPPDNMVAWLFRVVRNAAISAARADQRRRYHESAAAAQIEPWFTNSGEARLDVESATAALGSLPIEQREIIVAHIWGGLSFEEIAPVAGVSSSTAHRWYLAGLSSLRERLGVPWPNKPPIPS